MEDAAHIAYSPLPALLVLWPLACALLVRPLGRWREDARNAFLLFATGVTVLGSAALVPLIGAEHRIGCTIPAVLGTLNFTVDSYGMLFALFTSFVWFCATLYSLDYMRDEHARDRFQTASLVLLAANLGVVLAADLVTLYVFFEVLGLVAFLLVIHTETDQAKRAAIKYAWMTVLGGFALIGGIFLTYALGGSGLIAPLPLEQSTETLRWVTFGLLILGFGVKAGMLPVHVWLPDAHPVAPSPASALLSGVMIKAGAYGIFRTVTALFRPGLLESGEEELWRLTSSFGLVVLWLGIATMAVGVILALGQSNSKRMLAYHSVSQMGFILAGIGAAGYLGMEGAMGVAGGLYHVVNHALFKACLFLGVGVVAYRTGELDMYKLGGLWRKMPITFVFMLIAAAGITGVPLFNGFVSKCLIHHSLVEAYEFHELWSLSLAEKVYIVTCGGTVCSFIKLIGFTFLGTPKREYGPEVTDAPPRMLTAMGLLAAFIILLGLRPQLLLEGVIAPGLHAWGLSSELLEHYINVLFLSPADLMAAATAFAIGIVIFIVGMRFGLFHLRAPAWFGVDYWYGRFARGFVTTCRQVDVSYERYLAAVSRFLRSGLVRGAPRWIAEWYERYLAAVSRWLRSLRVGYASEWARAHRSWQRFTVTLSTGAAGPRHQHFIQHAYIVLERERQSTVRTAVSESADHLHARPHVEPATRTATLQAVRDIASYMSTRLRTERMGVLSDMVRTGEIDAVREGFDDVVDEVRVFRQPVADAALELAEKRMRGENVTRAIAASVNRILSEERFDRRLRDAAGGLPVSAAFREWEERGLGRLEFAARWIAEIARFVVAALTQERSSWLFAEHLEAGTIIATRHQIQRYARDMSFNVAVILIVLLVLLASIAAGAGR